MIVDIIEINMNFIDDQYLTLMLDVNLEQFSYLFFLSVDEK